ncbi:MAG: class I SAM-dependent methyltransferase, partial [Alphaproteobacteria bacterium]|nr:class I SAM-dependent methyltransferase [Alphaproteobacteria bacterium]
MQNIFAKLKHNFTVTKPDLIDLLVLLFFIGFGWLVVDLWGKPHDIVNIITIACIIYFMIRTVYERVYNRTSIPTLETPSSMIRAMADILKKDFEDKKQSTYHVVDFGSGDGQLTRKIAHTIPQANVLGIENAKIPYTQSMFFKKLFGIKNVDYQRSDFFDYDCRNIDAVVMYLSVQISQKLGEKLYNEIKPGAIVLSNEFELKGQWPKPETLERFTPFKTTLFIY